MAGSRDPSFVRRLLAGAKASSLRGLWLAAIRERASPLGIASSIAVGVFSGCTPLIGLHAGIAFAAATLLRMNRLWAVVGSRISFFPILPFVVFAEIQTAHRLRTGFWAPLVASEAIAHKKEWLLDWCLGAIPIGAGLALVAGAVAYAVARRRESLTPRTPAGSPPRTSESPP